MKLFLLCLVFSCLLPAQILAGESVEQTPVPLRSIQADFLQEKHLKILASPIISKGTFTFQVPQSLRWEYRSPVASILLMHGGKVKKFIGRDGGFQEEKTGGLDSMQVVLTEISNWLDGRFTDNKMFSVSFPDKQAIVLTPKEQGFAALISSIELKLADQQGLLDAVTIFEGPESYTRLTFTNSILNEEIPAAVFSVR